MAAPPVFPYTSLPPEIRALILHHALVPGDVYPCPPAPPAPSPASKLLRAVFKRPVDHRRVRIAGVDHHVAAAAARRPRGFQLLSTCREAYEEGRRMFYRDNVFHLPAGSAADAERWAKGLREEDRGRIRSVCLTLSVRDITPGVLEEMERRWLWDLPVKTARLEQRMVFEVAYALCWRYWVDKVTWVRGWEGLERVEVRWGAGGEQRVVFGGEAWRGVGGEEMKGWLEGGREVVRGELEGLVGGVGWRGARRALMGG